MAQLTASIKGMIEVQSLLRIGDSGKRALKPRVNHKGYSHTQFLELQIISIGTKDIQMRGQMRRAWCPMRSMFLDLNLPKVTRMRIHLAGLRDAKACIMDWLNWLAWLMTWMGERILIQEQPYFYQAKCTIKCKRFLEKKCEFPEPWRDLYDATILAKRKWSS